MHYSLLLPLLILVGPAITAIVAMVGRSRGRDVPLSIHFMAEPPRFADERLNRIETFLIVVVTPIGLLFAPAAILVGAADHYTLMYGLLAASLVLLNVRAIFVTWCMSFAELADEPLSAIRA